MNATLALEDGTWYRGVSAGAPGETSGEVVFNTSMTGYQEVLTEQAYAGQIVTLTAPIIDNADQAPASRGLRLRDQVDHPPAAGCVRLRRPRLPGRGARERAACDRA